MIGLRRKNDVVSVVVFFFALIFGSCHCHGRIFSFEMHHRFSDPVKQWSNGKRLSPSVAGGGGGDGLPEKGSFEYYAHLADRDRLLRGRKLLGIGNSPLAFSEGNSTFRISSLGFLHYTTVKLGTPGTTFMVALDTGSDLFWVPCDCSRCAPSDATSFAPDFQVRMYDPKGSSTSKKVSCNDSLCTQRRRCFGTFGSCPYMVSYVSAETSTSGILIADILHLKKDDKHQELVEAYITFGCGQVQSGSFLDVAAPNGLFGLGMEKISVPSILSREGLIANSFSMCFGQDGVGRISFGDKGSPDQDETPFNLNPSHPTYNISVTQIRVGTILFDADFSALFDSGTSFTYLVEPSYARLTESFHSQVQDRRHPTDSRIPFEYCYDMSSDANSSLIPSLSLTMKGGRQFAVYDPIIVISTQSEIVYCLAVVKSAELNIIGQNFMSGYRVVFDREKLVLGWKKFDCYDIDDYNDFPAKPNSTNVPPAVAAGLGNCSMPRSKQEMRNNQNSSASPSYRCHSIPLTCFRFLIFFLCYFLHGHVFIDHC